MGYNGFMHAKIIESSRLILNPMGGEYVSSQYLGWLKNPMASQFLASDFSTTDINDLMEFVTAKINNPDVAFWAICVKGVGQSGQLHIGNIKLEPIDFSRGITNFGVFIGETQYWSAGYGSEATEMVSRFAFDHLGLTEVQLGVVKENIHAIRCYERIGFKQYATLENSISMFLKNEMLIQRSI